MKKYLFFLCCFAAASLSAQTDEHTPGRFDLGIRTTTSVFGESGASGLGVGGQFRIRLLDRLNTEWFADYISTNLNGLGSRTDYHIGWSVLFYPANTERRLFRPMPYLLAGHCFDYTSVASNSWFAQTSVSRWSSAVQGGAGVHLPIQERIDFSFNAQYMMHLGDHIHTHVVRDPSDRTYLSIERDEAGLEGHLLLTFSLNVYVADLWKGKKS
jgi:hypothetical protein